MISHANGSAEWHREQLGIKQCERCLKHISGEGVHTCTPTKGWWEMEQRIAELEEANRIACEDIVERHNRIAELAAELAECKRDAARYRWLRETLETAQGSASVEVNRELAYYEPIEEGKNVRIQWYPDTPVGFYLIEAATMDEAIDSAIAAQGEGK